MRLRSRLGSFPTCPRTRKSSCFAKRYISPNRMISRVSGNFPLPYPPIYGAHRGVSIVDYCILPMGDLYASPAGISPCIRRSRAFYFQPPTDLSISDAHSWGEGPDIPFISPLLGPRAAIALLATSVRIFSDSASTSCARRSTSGS